MNCVNLMFVFWQCNFIVGVKTIKNCLMNMKFLEKRGNANKSIRQNQNHVNLFSNYN